MSERPFAFHSLERLFVVFVVRKIDIDVAKQLSADLVAISVRRHLLELVGVEDIGVQRRLEVLGQSPCECVVLEVPARPASPVRKWRIPSKSDQGWPTENRDLQPDIV
jgi:hypothetical protein